MARREFTIFSLSFLDVMACGLGAVILFLMITSAQVRMRAEQANDELIAVAERLKGQVNEAEEALKRANERDRAPEVPVVSEIERLKRLIAELKSRIVTQEATSLAKKESVEQLRADIQRLEEANARLAISREDPSSGARVRSFVGQGNRQYLTGIKMGGKRVLILVDASSSMLGRTFTNVIRMRAMPEARRRQATKWRQVVGSVDWLATRVTPGAKFQLYYFNEEVKSAIPGTEGEWIDVEEGKALERALRGLRGVTPRGGTSFVKAFRAARQLTPVPDNIYFLTDGFPTQDEDVPAEVQEVSAVKRRQMFVRAVGELPPRVPVNILLYPMDGDPDAAVNFWSLALRTKGSMMTPSRDWP